MKSKKNIVVIEDDPLVNQTIFNVLNTRYEKLECFTDAFEARDKLHLINPDLILLDIFLGHLNGLDVLEDLRKEG
jgi:DNA-binding response OmpR family regulator